MEREKVCIMEELDYIDELLKEQIVNGVVPAIRILPMSENDKEFNGFSIEDLQEWFITILPGRVYQFKTGMNAEPGTIVLFQYKSHIVALATLADKIIYKMKMSDGYKGCYVFEPYSISTFIPITALDMKRIWFNFKGFNQSQKILHTDLEEYLNFGRLLKNRNVRRVNI
jgi:hypothetical protein